MHRCDLCRATFTTRRAFDNHLGSNPHKERGEAQEEATRIWTLFHLLRGPTIPDHDVRESLEDGKRRNRNLVEIVPLGAETKVAERKRGTVECKLAVCHGSAHIHLGGLQPWLVFENYAYKINGTFDCFKPFFNYVLTCVAHPLYHYDGKMNGKTVTVAKYCSMKQSIIRSLKKKLDEIVNLENCNEADLLNAILNLRSENANRCYDSYLHFTRHDCHPLFMRMHVTATYATEEEVNANEAHQQARSGSTKYWEGSHNRVNEKGFGKTSVDNSRNKRSYAPPVSFVMMAPMSSQEDLDLWMNENGLNRELSYPENYLISSFKKPCATTSSSSASATTVDASTSTTNPSAILDFIDPSEFTTDPTIEEGMSVIQCFFPEAVNADPICARICTESLRDIRISDERRVKKNIDDLGS